MVFVAITHRRTWCEGSLNAMLHCLKSTFLFDNCHLWRPTSYLKMVKTCMVQGCSSKFKEGCDVSFFQFPNCDVTKAKWVENLDLPDVDGQPWQPTKAWQTVCSKHFSKPCFQKQKATSSGAAPSRLALHPAAFPTMRMHVGNVKLKHRRFDRPPQPTPPG